MPRARANPPVLKKFGQHFLTDRAALEAIVSTAAPLPSDTVVEIGPGRGALTDLLVAGGRRVIAIEIDRALAAALRDRYAGLPNVAIVEQDVLDVDLSTLGVGPFVVVGNVPYYITTPILFHVMRPPYPRHAVFLVQKEVADRIVSPPGSKSYGALSVNVQAIAKAEIIREVPPSAFRPPPRVHSAVVKLTPVDDPLVAPSEVDRFRGFVQALFAMRRKQLGNSLRSAADLSADRASSVLGDLGIDPKERAESLAPSQLASLMRAALGRGGSSGTNDPGW